MSNLVFLPEAWKDYVYWQGQDKKTLRKINKVSQDISRNAFTQQTGGALRFRQFES
jgi:Txe/YoeB family toxin of Txe-Axe toxin-antitoxin module